ncbi:MAG: hypothetical protein KGZ83_08205 [Sulfuricella sp.]|nr:hypothetical protein [Sulfuricella sp.]
MDENAYQETYNALNRNECPFEPALIICRHACHNARRIGIGERVAVGCVDATAQAACKELLSLLHHNAAFALHLTEVSMLPHSKELKVQCGGLRGLFQAVEPDAATDAPIEDIADLVAQASEDFEGLENLPFSEIMRSVTHFEARKKK